MSDQQSTQVKVPFYQATWFVILMMFCCCFPIGLFLMWKYKKFNKPVRIIITVFFAIMMIAGIATSGSSSEPVASPNTSIAKETTAVPEATTIEETTTVPETTTVAETTTVEKTSFGVGDSAEQKNIIVTLNSITESEGSTYNTPTDGNIFVLAEFLIENNSDKEINISSMLSFDAYQDGYSTNTSFTALMAKENSEQLDGTIAPGKKMKGVVGYEIPVEYKELEINVQLDVWSNKKITFVYEK